jgi:predicted AlkP superfamily phosphohydrolase/phosphomutase
MKTAVKVSYKKTQENAVVTFYTVQKTYPPIKSCTVLVTNNGEPSVVTCICCAELELELEKTRIEHRLNKETVQVQTYNLHIRNFWM